MMYNPQLETYICVVDAGSFRGIVAENTGNLS